MKALFLALGTLVLLAACNNGPNTKADAAPAGTGEQVVGEIQIASVTPYLDEDTIADKVKVECKEIGTKVSNFTKSYSAEKGITIKQVSEVSKERKKGNVLVVKIVSVRSAGNPFIGHNKAMTVKASLYKNGALVDKVVRSRDSAGGFGAGFKSSCSVLGRITKALGSDLSIWLQKYAKKQ